MTVELFEGKPEALEARLTALIGGGSVINFIFQTSSRAKYIILYT